MSDDLMIPRFRVTSPALKMPGIFRVWFSRSFPSRYSAMVNSLVRPETSEKPPKGVPSKLISKLKAPYGALRSSAMVQFSENSFKEGSGRSLARVRGLLADAED